MVKDMVHIRTSFTAFLQKSVFLGTEISPVRWQQKLAWPDKMEMWHVLENVDGD